MPGTDFTAFSILFVSCCAFADWAGSALMIRVALGPCSDGARAMPSISSAETMSLSSSLTARKAERIWDSVGFGIFTIRERVEE